MTENIILIKPDHSFIQQLQDFKEEFKSQKNGIAGSSYLVTFENNEDWLQQLKLLEHRATLPNQDFVPGQQFILVRTNDLKILGMANLRLELNDYLANFGGHIGYSIAPSEQQKGYGKLILQKTLQKAKEVGLTEILITCDDDNLGSIKIIEANSGVLENKVFLEEENVWVRRYWIRAN